MDLRDVGPCKSSSFRGKTSILLIGIGNPLRADDSAGQIVASEFRRRALRFLRVAEHAGDGTSLIELWEREGSRIVIVVDAVASGAAPGTIHRLDATRQPLPAWRFHGSTHQIGLAEAVELARITNRLPERLIIYGIEGRSFDLGGELSPDVRNALPAAVELVLKELYEITCTT